MFGKFEPVINTTIIVELLGAIITVLVAFNVPVTEDQRNAIIGLAIALGALFGLGAGYMRSQVTPVRKVTDVVIPAAIAEGRGSGSKGDAMRALES